MANTSLDQFIDTLHGTLGFANNTGSVSLYMAHGGTNFGFTAGASLALSMPFDVLRKGDERYDYKQLVLPQRCLLWASKSG